jgi:Skp family chaperone for outer membrane proteins
VKQITFTFELLSDFSDLIDDFKSLWSINNIHLAAHLDKEGQEVMEKLAKYNNECGRKVSDVIKKPLKNYYEYNKKVLEKHFSEYVRFFHKYLKHVAPKYKKYRPDIYKDRVEDIIKHYKKFHKKYL